MLFRLFYLLVLPTSNEYCLTIPASIQSSSYQ